MIPLRGKEWVPGFEQEEAVEYWAAELVLKGATVYNWSELITIQKFANIRGTPEAFLEVQKVLRVTGDLFYSYPASNQRA